MVKYASESSIVGTMWRVDEARLSSEASVAGVPMGLVDEALAAMDFRFQRRWCRRVELG